MAKQYLDEDGVKQVWDATKSKISDAVGNKVSKTGDTMTGVLKVDEIDNTEGNAMVRYKSTEDNTPIVVGSSTKQLVLMGSLSEPSYSSSEADFGGSAIMLFKNAIYKYRHSVQIYDTTNYHINVSFQLLHMTSTTITKSNIASTLYGYGYTTATKALPCQGIVVVSGTRYMAIGLYATGTAASTFSAVCLPIGSLGRLTSAISLSSAVVADVVTTLYR